jgi:hypothetical protein
LREREEVRQAQPPAEQQGSCLFQVNKQPVTLSRWNHYHTPKKENDSVELIG